MFKKLTLSHVGSHDRTHHILEIEMALLVSNEQLDALENEMRPLLQNLNTLNFVAKGNLWRMICHLQGFLQTIMNDGVEATLCTFHASIVSPQSGMRLYVCGIARRRRSSLPKSTTRGLVEPAPGCSL